MKKLLLGILTLSSLVSFAGTPVEKLVPVDEIFSPKGFDSNDSSEIIISGWLPNLCHKNPMTKFEIKGDAINITVSALSYQASNPFCPEMMVPFVESVNVGLLDKGQYKIVVNGKTEYEMKSDIFINESTSNAIDEHIYANVDYVDQRDFVGTTVTLKGYTPSDCLELDKVEFVSNGSNTYSVLPIMKQINDFCPMKMTPFAYDIEVPKTLNKARVLLHVRGMDGKSINSIFSR